MTPSIRQVPKLIFHDVDPGDPPAPLISGFDRIQITVNNIIITISLKQVAYFTWYLVSETVE